MTVSIVELYEKTGTNASQFALMPSTKKVDGLYPGVGMTDMTLGILLSVYHDSELANKLESIEEDEANNGWARVLDTYSTINRDRDEDIDSLEYSIMICRDKGYIEIEQWDGIRYFKPTEKCMNVEMYRR